MLAPLISFRQNVDESHHTNCELTRMGKVGTFTYRCTPLLHMMMWQAPSLSHSSEETDSRPTPDALHAVFAQAAVRLDLMNEATRR